jgi:hypothetical protein
MDTGNAQKENTRTEKSTAFSFFFFDALGIVFFLASVSQHLDRVELSDPG